MIKNDIWIKQKASEGMIEPFESQLIRQVEDRKVISYGLSSFGYDIRLSPKDFRVFRHIPGTVVDPKNFNPENLQGVELQSDASGDYFIIPAHSYGLGVAVEQLNIPDTITIICIGKSTYARCFTGDTRVKLVDGDYSFLELIERWNRGETLYGYGVDSQREIVVQELVSPRYIENSEVIRVWIDSGGYIDCTPDHQFLARSGEYIDAVNLEEGMSLHPIYEYHSHGYPVIFDSVKADKCSSRLDAMQEIHRMVAQRYIGTTERMAVHHKDGNRFNNHPVNLEILSNEDHIRLHNEQDGFHLKGGARFREKFREDPLFRQKILGKLHSDESKRVANQNAQWWKQSAENRDNLLRECKQQWESDSRRQFQSEVASRGMASLRRRDDITEDSVTFALLKTGSIRGAARLLNVDRTAFRRFSEVIERFKAGELSYNHKVLRVERLNISQPVYCLTAPATGNFALSTGVFVKNCGIIANLTPAEAGWRGHLTLEFSNSSSADCRIYTNEGVAQLLFFEGEPCETSYETRKGKYQQQLQEVTLARV